MSLREFINKKPAASLAVIFILAAAAFAFALWSNSGKTVMRRAAKCYFTADDGVSYFAAGIDQIPPFDHDGKPAIRAYVFKDDDGQPFVGYLEKYPDAVRQKLIELSAQPDENGQAIADLMGNAAQVKKPGDSKWVARFSDKGEAITQVPRSSNGAVVVSVTP